MDDDADTVVTTTDVGHGYNEDHDDTLSLSGSSRASSHGQTMEEIEKATRDMLVAAPSKVLG